MSEGNALVDELAGQIRAKIMSGDIPIGAPLRQADLAAQFGTSRTPIREALRQLQSGGLIDVMPNRGATVRVPAPWEVRETYQVRAELEALAAQLAVDRLDKSAVTTLRTTNDEMYKRSLAIAAGKQQIQTKNGALNDQFHELIYEAAGNHRLTRLLTEINEAFPRNVSALVLQENARHREENFREHGQIVDAIEAGDRDKAASIMREHIQRSGEHLASWYEQRSSTVFNG